MVQIHLHPPIHMVYHMDTEEKATKRINKALLVATQSTYKHRMGAVIYKKGRLIGYGYNKINCSTQKLGKSKQGTIHAEKSAVISCIKHSEKSLDKVQGASIYVSRITRSNSIGLAKPCSNCEKLLRAVGIKWVYYTENNGTISILNLKD